MYSLSRRDGRQTFKRNRLEPSSFTASLSLELAIIGRYGYALLAEVTWYQTDKLRQFTTILINSPEIVIEKA